MQGSRKPSQQEECPQSIGEVKDIDIRNRNRDWNFYAINQSGGFVEVKQSEESRARGTTWTPLVKFQNLELRI